MRKGYELIHYFEGYQNHLLERRPNESKSKSIKFLFDRKRLMSERINTKYEKLYELNYSTDMN